ncbi:MAG: hypothetical protein EZS26_000986 [Candidatus Ordinivivax streblomastigis]|uniref:Uncharacterized protein n=1 Tax=Candidatus Ordinivivax streblomastigis TaxID=2540710 RepID=A0A5M8P3B7_9BACT|nr:MAG: hypothetical protein EZS26_000986 [Candidatus Ordinivivax streblomastigis]
MIDNDFYTKEFTCGSSSLSRGELESLPCPFCTENVSDETMQKIIDLTDSSTRERLRLPMNKPLNLGDDKVSAIWWEELEAIVNQENIPYYEDL